MINKNIYITIAIIFCVLAFLYVEQMDYEDALNEQRIYCERVNSGFWGDYNGSADEVCK